LLNTLQWLLQQQRQSDSETAIFSLIHLYLLLNFK
jgi:hypothetical protein